MKSTPKPTLRTIRICYVAMMLGLIGAVLLPNLLTFPLSPIASLAIYCIVTAPLVVYLAINEHRRQRESCIGHCPTCGYDLRANPGRCSECGMAVANGDSIEG